MDVKKIAQLGWEKNWTGKHCLLMISISGPAYMLPQVKAEGAEIPHSLYIHKKGTTTCYLPTLELTNCFDNVAKEVVKDNRLLAEWPADLRRLTDQMRYAMRKPLKEYLAERNYRNFYRIYEKYEYTQVTVKIIADFLPPELTKKYGKVLEGARRHTEPIYDEVEVFYNRIAGLISKKEGYPLNLVLSMTHEELIIYLETGSLPVRKELKKRYCLSALYYDHPNKYIITKGVSLMENLIAKQSGLVSGRVNGVSAYKGKVRGKCRIISSGMDFEKFKPGEVLITSMTRPEFLPIISKSVAIVTDAGGVLSHAAIVAREMKKPCITGTKVATKAFKDGDLVEVDANKGVVRILKKNK